MPTYLYECDHCGEFEVDQRLSDKPLTECIDCKSEQVKRLVAGRTSFVLRGNGWASDGYS